MRGFAWLADVATPAGDHFAVAPVEQLNVQADDCLRNLIAVVLALEGAEVAA
ncbi:hypothetical protein [Halomonas sp. AOP35-4E-18]|uniref:hypothetical protein n=1 Tax=Halomonas sp. AOP35-4E-18 TaxID=3457686 RepID=UPI0040336AA9